MHREALAIRRRLPGDHRKEIADSLYDLSLALQRQGKRSEAQGAVSESVEMMRALPESNVSGALSQSLIRLCSIMLDQGKLTEAEALAREAAELERKRDGHSLWALPWVGKVLDAEGKLAESEAALREAVDLHRHVFGNDHFVLAGTLHTLGNTLRQSGKLEEAEATIRESVAVYRKSADQQRSPHLAWTLDSLAAILTAQDNFSDAEKLLREALSIKTRVFGPANGDTLATRSALIEVVKQQGKSEEVEKLRRE
jgi:tetratricopeptide (TPR) repeat protein